ncbi:MAG: hypothetical protein AB1Z65_13060 [Candidatus Sulfomarinibacteraceae bacterium]
MIRRVLAHVRERPLLVIKVVHTIVWVFFVVCIVAVPVLTRRGAFATAACLAAVVLVEVLVLVFNRWSCPLTPVAARHTDDRRANFDIFLPEWLARHNKTVFGWLYVGGLVYLLVSWMSQSD